MCVVRQSSGSLCVAARAMACTGLLALAGFISACGGGNESAAAISPPGSPAPTPPPPAPSPTPVEPPSAVQVSLQSDAGDAIGLGRSYAYSLANANIALAVRNGAISITVTGDEDWQGDFQVPQPGALQVVRHDDVPRYPQSSTAQASMRWFGGGRGCSTSTGWFSIDQLSYSAGGFLNSIILRFERRCDGSSAALRGEVRWLASDGTRPPAIANPPPDSLWRPSAGVLPASGNFLYVRSEPGDHVGLGRTHLFTPKTASLAGSGGSREFSFFAWGAETWRGVFVGRDADGRILPGHYPDLVRYPFANPTRGGMGWLAAGRACPDPRGWAAVDRVEYDRSTLLLSRMEMRFEQRCTAGGPALRGALRWSAADAAPPADIEPPSAAGSWRPPAGATPASGTYVYLQGAPGEAISGGGDYLFTPETAVLSATEVDASLSGITVVPGALRLKISAQASWEIDVRSQADASPWRTGVSANLPRVDFADFSRPRFSLSGRGLGCESLSWLAVDRVVYDGALLRELDFRFEQICDQGTRAPLRGEVHWRADDLRQPPGPARPAPDTFWRPQASSISAGLNLVQIDSTRSDFVGGGLRASYTAADSVLAVVVEGPVLTVQVSGDENWTGTFSAMAGLSRLEPGYYGGLQHYPFHNQARGGMYWYGEGRGCNVVEGGFVIDDIRYASDGTLDAVSLRFEQHCEASTSGASWGAVRWSRADLTAPPGPVAAPAGLWSPPAGAIPAGGSYLYFESLAGDFVGGGRTALHSAADAAFAVTQRTEPAVRIPQVIVDVTPRGQIFPWDLSLRAMSPRTKLEPGYYGAIRGSPFQNPAKGGLNFSGEGRGCNQIEGWFMVDSVGYVGDTLSALQLRFAQVCDGAGVLYGALRWQRP